MSVNKNLSKLALNVNANGDVTEAGLSATYTSNGYSQGRFTSNNFVKNIFTSNNYVASTLDTRIGLRATNTYVQSTFTSNNYVQEFTTNATNLASGTIASGLLSGTYAISISGSADRLDGLDAVAFSSNSYLEGRFTSNNYVDGNFTSNNFLTTTRDLYQHKSVTKTFTVTVDTKSSNHRYNGTGSANGFKIDGIEAPIITLLPGSTYRFDQADSSNSGHPILFYLDSAKASAWTAGVTTNGTAGNAGAYTEITAAENTPFTLHYQCSAHSNMGNAVNIIGLETETLNIKDSAGSTVKTIRGV
jgi:hypothetical protein